jgi:hypothetical protein
MCVRSVDAVSPGFRRMGQLDGSLAISLSSSPSVGVYYCTSTCIPHTTHLHISVSHTVGLWHPRLKHQISCPLILALIPVWAIKIGSIQLSFEQYANLTHVQIYSLERYMEPTIFRTILNIVL